MGIAMRVVGIICVCVAGFCVAVAGYCLFEAYRPENANASVNVGGVAAVFAMVVSLPPAALGLYLLTARTKTKGKP